jgi:hypothetical protein
MTAEARGEGVIKLLRPLTIGIAALLATPAGAVNIRELAKYDQPVLVAHIMGSLAGLAAGLNAAGNREAAQCVRLWAAPPAGNTDPKALTDILTQFAETLGKLSPSSRVPDYEAVLATALRKQCGAVLPSAGP